jgi:hypothetical protein
MPDSHPKSTHHSNEILLGTLIGRVDRLIKDSEEAKVSRKNVYTEQESIRTELHAMNMKLAALEKDVAPLKAFQAKADRWEQRGIGALALFGMLASALGAALGAQWGRVSQWFGWG